MTDTPSAAAAPSVDDLLAAKTLADQAVKAALAQLTLADIYDRIGEIASDPQIAALATRLQPLIAALPVGDAIGVRAAGLQMVMALPPVIAAKKAQAKARPAS